MDEKPIIINIPAIYTWTLKELKYACKKNKVKGYTKMSREELVTAVENIVLNFKNSEANNEHN